jgi:hypothetical protein
VITTIRPCECSQADPLGTDITYDDGLVLDQHFSALMTGNRHGELLYLAEHPHFPAAFEILNFSGADGPCCLPLTTDELIGLHIRLHSRAVLDAWIARLEDA